MSSLADWMMAAVIVTCIVIAVTAVWNRFFPFVEDESFREEREQAERNIREMTRSTVTLITIPLVQLVQRRIALSEERIADRETETSSVPRLVLAYLDSYLDRLEETPLFERLDALESELEILKKHLQGLLAEDQIFCAMKMLVEIDECRGLLDTPIERENRKLVAIAKTLFETWNDLEMSIYQLAAHIAELEKDFGFNGSDGGMYDGAV